MINGRKIVVVMPAYNAELTLRKTYNEIPGSLTHTFLKIITKEASNLFFLSN